MNAPRTYCVQHHTESSACTPLHTVSSLTAALTHLRAALASEAQRPLRGERDCRRDQCLKAAIEGTERALKVARWVADSTRGDMPGVAGIGEHREFVRAVIDGAKAAGKRKAGRR